MSSTTRRSVRTPTPRPPPPTRRPTPRPQRCVGMAALIPLHSVTHDIDRKHGTAYHERFKKFLVETQDRDLMSGGAMTDPKGDRSKRPHEQHDPDLFVRVVEGRDEGIVVRGAKMH